MPGPVVRKWVKITKGSTVALQNAFFFWRGGGGGGMEGNLAEWNLGGFGEKKTLKFSFLKLL